MDYIFIWSVTRPSRGGRLVEDKDSIYAAGLVDGEGTITLSRLHAGDRFRAPVVSLSSTTLELVEFLRSTFGGAICKHKTYKLHHKAHWSWRVVRNGALEFLQTVGPFLKEPEKSRRARLLIEIYPKLTPRNGRYSARGLEEKLAFEDRFLHPSSP